LSNKRPLSTYNNERRVIEAILAIDVHTLADKFLASSQISTSTGHEELMKFGGFIERVLIEKNATLDEPSFLSKLSLELKFAENHDRL
jgi:hypothetical protein